MSLQTQPTPPPSSPRAAPGSSGDRSILGRVQRVLGSARGPQVTGLLALLISLPALALGLQSDDHILAWQLEHGEQPWGLFQVDAAQLAEGRATGGLAWWTSPRLSIAFLRPLASLTHYLDFTWWPEAAWLMSLENVLIYAGCAFVAARLYRRLHVSPAVGAIAALAFAWNEANAMSVGWIAGRNTLLGMLGSLGALWLHVRAVDERRPALRLASAACVAFALLSAEAGTWALCLLLAYALTLQAGSLRVRLVGIAPQLSVGVLWALTYVATHRGLRGSSFYRELSAPLDFLAQGLLDLPLSLLSLFGPSVIGFALLVPAEVARLWALPFAVLSSWLVWSERRDPATRFFAACTALCLLPAFLTVGQDRVLMGASFGAIGLIAAAIHDNKARPGLAPRVRRTALIALHLVLAPLYFPVSLASVRRFENGTRALVAAVEPRREVVLINTPVELLANYTSVVLDRRSRSAPPPSSVHQLYAGGSELWVERIDERSLDITATRGWGYAPFERIFCAPRDMPKAGSTVHNPRFTAQVLRSTPDGMPQRVRFSFPTPLESPERQWLVWQGARPIAFTPPRLGERVRLAPLALLEALPL